MNRFLQVAAGSLENRSQLVAQEGSTENTRTRRAARESSREDSPTAPSAAGIFAKTENILKMEVFMYTSLEF